MIPKIIHYCWFGKKSMPKLAEKCIASWKKFCPDYQIIEWNESNFDLNFNVYVQEAYKAKKWAFVTDVVRLFALANYGGIYMDTDVEVLKPLNCILQFDAVLGLESATHISTALMACNKNHPNFKEFLADYNNIHFVNTDGTFDTTPNIIRITNHCLKYGFVQKNIRQNINGITILPQEYLCPKDFDTYKVSITENTICIHYFDGSWIPAWRKITRKIFVVLCGTKCKNKLKHFFERNKRERL